MKSSFSPTFSGCREHHLSFVGPNLVLRPFPNPKNDLLLNVLQLHMPLHDETMKEQSYFMVYHGPLRTNNFP